MTNHPNRSRQDHPRCRAQKACPICGCAKKVGRLMCWECWYTGGKTGEHDSQIDAAEEYEMTKELNRTETVAQIEVTPEMREAGGEIFASFFDYFEHAEDIAEEIYREMELARRFKPGEYPRSSLRGP